LIDSIKSQVQELLEDLDLDAHQNRIIQFKMKIMKNQKQKYLFNKIYCHTKVYKMNSELLHQKGEQHHKSRKEITQFALVVNKIM